MLSLEAHHRFVRALAKRASVLAVNVAETAEGST
jgi:hypothetical protein